MLKPGSTTARGLKVYLANVKFFFRCGLLEPGYTNIIIQNWGFNEKWSLDDCRVFLHVLVLQQYWKLLTQCWKYADVEVVLNIQCIRCHLCSCLWLQVLGCQLIIIKTNDGMFEYCKICQWICILVMKSVQCSHVCASSPPDFCTYLNDHFPV